MPNQPIEAAGLPDPDVSEVFVAAMQDRDTRVMLAAQLATKGFYGPLDQGASFDESLTFALRLAIHNIEYLEDVAAGNVRTTDAEGYLDVLNEARNKEAPRWAPSRLRRGIARLALREYIHVGPYTVPVTFRAIRKNSRFVQEEDA